MNARSQPQTDASAQLEFRVSHPPEPSWDVRHVGNLDADVIAGEKIGPATRGAIAGSPILLAGKKEGAQPLLISPPWLPDFSPFSPFSRFSRFSHGSYGSFYRRDWKSRSALAGQYKA